MRIGNSIRIGIRIGNRIGIFYGLMIAAFSQNVWKFHIVLCSSLGFLTWEECTASSRNIASPQLFMPCRLLYSTRSESINQSINHTNYCQFNEIRLDSYLFTLYNRLSQCVLYVMGVYSLRFNTLHSVSRIFFVAIWSDELRFQILKWLSYREYAWRKKNRQQQTTW